MKDDDNTDLDSVEVIIAVDPGTIKSFNDIIPVRADWMSDDDYRSDIYTVFELMGAHLGLPLTEEVWEYVGLSPEYDDPDGVDEEAPAPKI